MIRWASQQSVSDNDVISLRTMGEDSLTPALVLRAGRLDNHQRSKQITSATVEMRRRVAAMAAILARRCDLAIAALVKQVTVLVISHTISWLYRGL